MEFLIRVVDKGVAMDCSKRGDVISACSDGWAWSAEELNNDYWRIISVLGILQSAVDAAMSSAPPDAVIPLGQRKRRNWMIDFLLLPDPSLFSGARTLPIISLTKNQVQGALVKKP